MLDLLLSPQFGNWFYIEVILVSIKLSKAESPKSTGTTRVTFCFQTLGQVCRLQMKFKLEFPGPEPMEVKRVLFLLRRTWRW